MTTPSKVLLQVENLVKHFPVHGNDGFFRRKTNVIHAVDGISFNLYKGETLGLVGESGCGKSTAGRTILQLYRPTSGSVLFDGIDLGHLPQEDLRKIRRRMQMIFQDPYASLNSRMTVGEIISDPLVVNKENKTRKNIEDRVAELLDLVKLNPAFVNRYPHEFSGGQRQRIGIARALALQPELIVCDEPISALDVSIQAQIVNLLVELQQKFHLTYLFISHDLSMVRHICDRVVVMYLGVIVEIARKNEFYRDPLHPYTRALLSAVNIPDPFVEEQRNRTILKGEIPSPVNPPSGCRFHTRCPIAQPQCAESQPELRELIPGHFVACFLATQQEKA
ncbi:MAG: ATP-binding cassette domain-containing protein [Chloroflexi bacterium]|nr:ATP-binding cassette domain-containing protein [Chloroflexota bacterium]